MTQQTLRYLRDNLRIFVRDKIEDTYAGAPIRLTGDERQLIADLLEFLEEQYEQRSKGGQAARGKSGRPRLPDDEISEAAKYQRERRAKLNNE